MIQTVDCHTCGENQRFETLAPRERIAADEFWRVAHCFDTALPGWLVLLPRRHITAIAEATDDEAAALGHWQVRLSRALHAVTGCAKTYVAQFAEAQGFAHVHFHIVPRMPDLAESLRGPRVFGLLDRPGEEQVTDDAMDALALRLRQELARHGGATSA